VEQPQQGFRIGPDVARQEFLEWRWGLGQSHGVLMFNDLLIDVKLVGQEYLTR
jgi:hypothetical protein